MLQKNEVPNNKLPSIRKHILGRHVKLIKFNIKHHVKKRKPNEQTKHTKSKQSQYHTGNTVLKCYLVTYLVRLYVFWTGLNSSLQMTKTLLPLYKNYQWLYLHFNKCRFVIVEFLLEIYIYIETSTNLGGR